MTYTDENGMTAFLQADDVFKWGGFEMVRFYMIGDFHQNLSRKSRTLGRE